MNFSEVFKQTSQLCKFSSDGKYLANAVQYRLIIRDVKTLQIIQLFTCLDAIQQIEWSPDSEFILCGMNKRGLVQVWSLEEPEWYCKIDEGSAGLVSVIWSPDSRHILTTAEFHLRITVWSLISKSVSYIKHPKNCQQGLDFSGNGKFLALAERRDCKDFVSIFACNTWQLLKHFTTDTEDLTGVMWSPDSRVLGVWEASLKYKVLLYSLDGRCLATYSPNQQVYALGAKSISWAPTSQFLAIGGYDEKVHLLNHLTWKRIIEFSHPATVTDPQVVVYKEVVKKPLLLQGETAPPSGLVYAIQSKYEVLEMPTSVPAMKPDLNKPNPKLGIGTLAFSADTRYMYTRNDNMPTALWIWDVHALRLAVLLVQDAPIKCVEWDSGQPRLALCTGNNKVYMWSAAGCLSVEIPTEASFQVHSLVWRPGGDALMLIGREDMCVCFLGDTGRQTTDTDPVTS